MRTVYLLVLLPVVAYAQQAITVSCLQNTRNGVVLFDNLALPIIPERHHWILLRYEPSDVVEANWRRGQCVVEEVMR